MTSSAINGVWIYRSFRNLTSPAPSFDELKVWDAEFYLGVEENCLLHRTLWGRLAIAAGLEPYPNVKGSAERVGPLLEFGRRGATWFHKSRRTSGSVVDALAEHAATAN